MSREVIFFDADRDDIDVDGEEACSGFGSHYVNVQPLARKVGLAVTMTEPVFTVGDQVVVGKRGSGVVKFVGSHKVEGENRLDRNFSPVRECLTGGMSSNHYLRKRPRGFVLEGDVVEPEAWCGSIFRTAFDVSGTMTVDLFGSGPQAPHGLASNSPKPRVRMTD